jgi:NADH dehydrogenase
VAPERGAYDLPYDHLVVALGASTNDRLIPGSWNALTFKTMADALVLRNHLIGRFERADAAADAAKRRGCLTVVMIGGGLVGVLNDTLNIFVGGAVHARIVPSRLIVLGKASNFSHNTSFAPPVAESRTSFPFTTATTALPSGVHVNE